MRCAFASPAAPKGLREAVRIGNEVETLLHQRSGRWWRRLENRARDVVAVASVLLAAGACGAYRPFRGGREAMKLREIAHSRTGDKGKHIEHLRDCLSQRALPAGCWRRVTAERVRAHFAGVCRRPKWSAMNCPTSRALNFVMGQTLGGGVTRSLALRCAWQIAEFGACSIWTSRIPSARSRHARACPGHPRPGDSYEERGMAGSVDKCT